MAVRAGVLRNEYQTADRQLVLVTGGFGSHANSRGSAVFCTNLIPASIPGGNGVTSRAR